MVNKSVFYGDMRLLGKEAPKLKGRLKNNYVPGTLCSMPHSLISGKFPHFTWKYPPLHPCGFNGQSHG